MIAAILLAFARQGEATQLLEGRVIVVGAGVVEIDRGRADGLREGDVVSFLPPGGPELRGQVGALAARTATVRVDDPQQQLDAGTRWECRIPVDRGAGAAPAAPGATPEHPPWEQPGQPWPADRPLLAPVTTLAPADRAPRFRGRVFTAADALRDAQRDSSSLYLRFGADLAAENLLGYGEEWHADGEWVHRTDSVQGRPDATDSAFRLDRLSVAHGGDRAHPLRWEAGRFLQEEFPEFGVLDGVEIGMRLPNGDRAGASAGWMPRLYGDYGTGDDLQTALFYRSLGGADDERSLGAGFQKTWHDGASDRDLLLLQAALQPRSGFYAYATAWVDLYGAADALKTSGTELTRLIALVGSRSASGDGWSLAGTMFRYPQLLQQTPSTVLAPTITDGSLRRLDLSAYRGLTTRTRGTVRVNAWSDELNSGGGGELRWEIRDLGGPGGRAGAAVFANQGSFSDVYGLRLDAALASAFGTWSLLWESSQNSLSGVSGPQGQLLLHRARAGWDLWWRGAWSVSLSAEKDFGDEQDTQSYSLYLQRSL